MIINTCATNTQPYPRSRTIEMLHNYDLMSVLTSVCQNIISFSTLDCNKPSFLRQTFNFYFHCVHVTIFNFHFVISKKLEKGTKTDFISFLIFFLQLYWCLIANPPNGHKNQHSLYLESDNQPRLAIEGNEQLRNMFALTASLAATAENQQCIDI